MKFILSVALIMLSVFGCRKSEREVIVPVRDMPYFNQVRTEFKSDHIQCLLDQWYASKYNEEPILLKVINDEQSYRSFFTCASNISLPPVDFTSNTLIVGMKADYSRLIDTPVNISKITQNLVKSDSASYSLDVVVTGKPTAEHKGGEWFAFTSLVPKITAPVALKISYQFQ